MTWITAPITYFALLAAVITVTLALFVSLRMQQARELGRLSQRCSRLEEELSVCRHLLARPASHSGPPGSRPGTPEASSALAGLKRDRALALYDEGQSPDRIAADLGLPKNQVELLGKVRRASAHA